MLKTRVCIGEYHDYQANANVMAAGLMCLLLVLFRWTSK